jgi:hypothetical protein
MGEKTTPTHQATSTTETTSDAADTDTATDGGCSTAVANITAARGVIDHQGYPHIIENVLAHADAQLLLTFRGTSKAYAHSCLKILMRHIVVRGQSSNWGLPPLDVRSARGLVRQFDQGIHSYTDLDARLAISSSQLNHCEILDFIGPTGPKCPRIITTRLAHLQTLRLLPSLYGDLSTYNFDCTAKTVVVFADLPLVYEHDHTQCRWKGPGWPATTTKLVWNVKGVIDSLERGKPIYHYRFHASIKQLVLHFTSSCIDNEVWESLDRLSQTIHYFLDHCNIKSVTIVDLHLVPLGLLDQPVLLALDHPEERQLRITQHLGTLADHVHFKTGDQYCAEVGAEQYRIETCETL